jgi:hypothetical protein
MKKLKYNSRKKEYTGIAFCVTPFSENAQYIVVGPSMELIKKFYQLSCGRNLNPKLCRKLKVKITEAK